jgi:hypothetical protein
MYDVLTEGPKLPQVCRRTLGDVPCVVVYPTVHARDPVALSVASPPAFCLRIRHIFLTN